MQLSIQPISSTQDQAMADIIRSVGEEFGAIGEGFGPSDDEVSSMSAHYHQEQGSIYLVASIDDVVVGGCGIAPFADYNDVCELKKLFVLPKYRALGLGRKLTEQCLQFAQQQGYQRVYLDTLSSMLAAIKMYEKMDFVHLEKPLAGTIHNGCDVWMVKTLNA